MPSPFASPPSYDGSRRDAVFFFVVVVLVLVFSVFHGLFV